LVHAYLASMRDDRRVLAGRPPIDVPVPPSVRELLAGRDVTPVWRNEAGGLTFEGAAGLDRVFVKWSPPGVGHDLDQEVARLHWAAASTSVAVAVAVPVPLGWGSDASGSWLMTAALPGASAVSGAWLEDPQRAVVGIGEGLRALHDALPAPGCPFSWTAEDRTADAHRQADAGELDPASWHDVHRSLSVPQALHLLSEPPPVDRLVVCHGDACAPNTLLDEHGDYTGHVDLGRLGLADRWADLAVATWSTSWNYGPGWENTLLSAYGVSPDPSRTAYYRLLWDLSS